MRKTINNISRKFISDVVVAAILSVVLNIVVLAIVRPITQAPSTFSPFEYGSVIELTFLGVLAAGFVYLGIQRFYPVIYKKIFIWIAVIALLVSLIPDIMLPFSTDLDNQGATPFIVIILMLMHVLTAGIVVWIFTRMSRQN